MGTKFQANSTSKNCKIEMREERTEARFYTVNCQAGSLPCFADSLVMPVQRFSPNQTTTCGQPEVEVCGELNQWSVKLSKSIAIAKPIQVSSTSIDIVECS